MIEHNTGEMPEVEHRLDDLAELCVSYSGLIAGSNVIADTTFPEGSRVFEQRRELVVQQIADGVKSFPGILNQLGIREREKIADSARLADVLFKETGPDTDNPSRRKLFDDIGRSTLVLSGLDTLRTSTKNKQIQRGFEESTFDGELVPGVTIEITTSGSIIVAGKKMTLKPLQVHIINRLLESPEPLTYKDIYDTQEFSDLVAEAGLRSPAVVNLTNNLNAIQRQVLKATGHEQSVIQKAGPKGSGTLRINPNSAIEDQSLLAQTHDLTTYIHSALVADTPIDAHALAAQFFGAQKYNARLQSPLVIALAELSKTLAPQGYRLANLPDGTYVLTENQVVNSTANEAPQTIDRGPLMKVQNGTLQFRDGSVKLDDNEYTILCHILERGEKGASKAYLADKYKKLGLDANTFERTYQNLHKKLGDSLVKNNVRKAGQPKFKVLFGR